MAKVSVKAKHQLSETKAYPASSTHLNKALGIATELREHMIAEAAYYLAEHRKFQGGDPEQDWLQAEAEIDRNLRGAPH